MSALKTAYTALRKHVAQIYHLNSVSSLLAWDEQTMMPHNAKASEARGLQNAAISGTVHDLWTSDSLTKILDTLEKENFAASAELNEFEKANVTLSRREWVRRNKIPKELVEEQSKLQSEGYMTWVEARKEANFEKFVPVLKKWLDIKKQVAHHVDPSMNAYEVMLDEYERELTTKRLDEIFSALKQRLVPFIKKVLDASNAANIDGSVLISSTDQFDVKKQADLNSRIAKDIGYSFDQGRLDVSVHPFTVAVVPHDVRITTRYKASEFLQGLAGTIHECGHGMYEQGLNADYFAEPVSAPLGMAIHESQSLLWERHVGLSKHFWQYAWPIVQEHFEHLKSCEKSTFEVYRAVNQVEPIFIRVESDEVTYPLHIVLRYEIEKQLFDGTITIEDLPKIWNSKMQEYLGVVPPSNKEGVLQDVHWSGGAFGYFPTYLVGQICAAQIFNAAKKQIPNLEENFAKGQFLELKQWLNKNIHSFGSLYAIDDLIVKVTGEPINPNYLMEFIEAKYSEIYNLK